MQKGAHAYGNACHICLVDGQWQASFEGRRHGLIDLAFWVFGSREAMAAATVVLYETTAPTWAWYETQDNHPNEILLELAKHCRIKKNGIISVSSEGRKVLRRIRYSWADPLGLAGASRTRILNAIRDLIA